MRRARKRFIASRGSARGLRLPLQASNIRRRQGTQGQRQAGAGLWTSSDGRVLVACTGERENDVTILLATIASNFSLREAQGF